ncbi:MAG: fibrobacter succinogenes major paralogous domain-containing protein [Chitinispirillales bacterium]|jgi:uncharacterized protein (TIGR02145 family)|nr:fibrobacter succinogenes major paralogous domain-containing protein [Chitinispirillales bacterium]
MFKQVNVTILSAIMLSLFCLSVYAQRGNPQRQRQEAQPSTAAAADNGNSFTDPRDGQTYRTVRIGNNTWMAQNLNYMAIDMSCYDNDPSNCAKYGFLYTWDAAMASCPAGWRLPAIEDWADLIQAAGDNAIAKLKSRSPDWNGTDDFGFSALPGGKRGGLIRRFSNVGDEGYWWSATSRPSIGEMSFATNVNIDSDSNVFEQGSSRSDAMSVRCIQ